MSDTILHRNLPVVEVSEKYILDTLLADPVSGQYILTRLSETIAVVWPGYVDTLLTKLRKQGHTPRIIQE
jgi:hypothetical protein